MFEIAELGRTLSKAEYEAVTPDLRTSLLKVQRRLSEARFPVVVLVHGADGAGKGETANMLHAWFDTRFLITNAYGPPTEDERERPEFWRYWMWLPPAGRMGVFLGSWYTQPILDSVYGRISDAERAQAVLRINAFEKALTDDGALVIKLWFHISKKEQKKRLKSLEKKKSTRWRVTRLDWKHHELYDAFVPVCESVLRDTSTGSAPWTVIESSDARYRHVTAAREIMQQIERRLDTKTEPAAHAPEPPIGNPVTILDRLDLSKSLEKAKYSDELPELQARLNRLSRRLSSKRAGAIFLFEGSDAAGKGGAIRRVTSALDARQYRVISIAAPTDEERAHHYLWRFWRHLPRRGRITVFDRSWYGRVLVERVEGFAAQHEWRRAYKEINDFETELVSDGIVLVKFWLHISSDEQLERFHDRERDPWKHHKITAEDYRNREKAAQYESAINEMIARTSTAHAPFTLVEANDKNYARIKVLRTICDRLAERLA
jgi:polyphosphate:AMP phosphotransferase